jgi:hypothetical protein
MMASQHIGFPELPGAHVNEVCALAQTSPNPGKLRVPRINGRANVIQWS